MTDVQVADGSLLVAFRDTADPAAIVRAVVEGGGAIEAVAEETTSLEATYLELIRAGN